MIFSISIGFSQTLPFDFESATPGMTGYDNATFTIVSNPSQTGINTSANVGRIVKVLGDEYAGGKITGISSLNFSNLSTSVLSMKIYTTQPAGTVIKIKLEGPFTGEVDAVTTTSGAWETLTFDFYSQAPSGSADLVIMPQPFTPGNGNTFYVDDIEQIAGTAVTPIAGLPLNFESGETTGNFSNFESAFLTVIPNPHIDAVNGSATVGQLIRYKGAPFGGSKITFSNNIDFSTETLISMKVWTAAPIGTNVTLKTEKPFFGVEKSVQTTKTGEWETLTFDFAGSLSDMPTLVFLFDFAAGSSNVGDGSANSTFFFDDVRYATACVSTTDPVVNTATLADVNAVCELASITAPTATAECGNNVTGVSNVTFPITALGETIITWTYTDPDGNSTTQDQSITITECEKILLPIDFENSVVDADFLNFDGAGASVIANPQSSGINTSATVGQIIRGGGEIWAGSLLQIDTILDFSSKNSISMKVYTEAPVGTTLKFKLESDTSDIEVDMTSTVSGEWETIIWNFKDAPTEFNKLTFLFDFGNVGDGSAASTFLFDDIMQVNVVDSGVNINDNKLLGINIFPNPTTNSWSFTSENENITSIVIYDISGKVIINETFNSLSQNIDASSLASGIYTAKVSTKTGNRNIKVVKK